MLVMKLKPREGLKIGDDIEIYNNDKFGGMYVAIEAPKEKKIVRINQAKKDKKSKTIRLGEVAALH